MQVTLHEWDQSDVWLDQKLDAAQSGQHSTVFFFRFLYFTGLSNMCKKSIHINISDFFL